MILDLHRAPAAAAIAAAVLLTGTSARAANDTVVVAPGASTPAPERAAESRPNTGLITSGLLTLGLSYGAAAVVAGSNSRSDDDRLWIPVAGPWMDLANREPCGELAGGGSCGSENTYKVLLVADGVLQGIGALQVLGGFLFPESGSRSAARALHTASAPPPRPTLRIAPSRVPGGYGLTALGTF